MSPSVIILLASVAAFSVAASYAITHFRRMALIRASALRIDTNYRKLSRRPVWAALPPEHEIPSDVADRLSSFESNCTDGLGFVPLARLSESNSEGSLLGYRTVLSNADATIVATFACSHTKGHISFRSLASRSCGRFFFTSEAKTAFERPDQIVIERIEKGTPEREMLSRHLGVVANERAALIRFESVDDYVA